MSNTNAGLEGVVVADTRISDVDGERGKLIIAGNTVGQVSGVEFHRAGDL